jgi:hypothetical protein
MELHGLPDQTFSLGKCRTHSDTATGLNRPAPRVSDAKFYISFDGTGIPVWDERANRLMVRHGHEKPRIRRGFFSYNR